jgi:hypothetical protein
VKGDILTYIKKLTEADKKSLIEKVLKTGEEYGELAKVALPYANVPTTQHRTISKNDVIEEGVDLILCALSVLYDVGATDEQIESTMYAKANKWEELQLTEEQTQYPLPFEIHITVERPDDIDAFVRFCKEVIEVKPIVLDLENGGETVMLDVMTSSKSVGTNSTAIQEAELLADWLEAEGYTVLRKKIESVPWHPAAPREFHKEFNMPKDCYFECHIGVKVSTKESKLRTLTEIASINDCHLSKNFFKKNDDGTFVQMITYRSSEKHYEAFIEYVEHLKNTLDIYEYEYEKVITEFSIFDTKQSHDGKWISHE